MTEPLLVLGAGAFSRAVVRALRARDLPVRLLTRAPVELGPGVEVRVGDAASLGTLLDAAKGAAAIVQGACPPLARWEAELNTLTDAVIEAAGLSGLPLLIPGPTWSIRPIPGVPLPPTVFDPDALDQIIPAGRQRQWIELQAQQLAETRNVRTVVLRASDWYGPGVSRGLLGWSLAGVAAGGPLRWYAPLDVPHDLVFVDDAASVAVEALLAADRPIFEVIHVTGHLVDAHALAGALGRVLGRSVSAAREPAWKLLIRGIVDPEIRAWRQALPLWEAPLQLDDRETRARGFVPTPLEAALARTFSRGDHG